MASSVILALLQDIVDAYSDKYERALRLQQINSDDISLDALADYRIDLRRAELELERERERTNP